MKKIISIFGAIVLATSLTGCVKIEITRNIHSDGKSDILITQDITQINSMMQQENDKFSSDENTTITTTKNDPCDPENFPEELKDVECSVSEDGNIITVSGKDETLTNSVEEKNGYLRYTYNPSHFSNSLVKDGENGDAFKEGLSEQEFNNPIMGIKSIGITWKAIEIHPGEVLYGGYGNVAGNQVVVENIYTTFDTFEKASAEYVIIVKTSTAQGDNPFSIPTTRLEEPTSDEVPPVITPFEQMMQGMVQGMANRTQKPTTVGTPRKVPIQKVNPSKKDISSEKMTKIMQELTKGIQEADNLMKAKEVESKRILKSMPADKQKEVQAKLEEIQKKEGGMVYLSGSPSLIPSKKIKDKILSTNKTKKGKKAEPKENRLHKFEQELRKKELLLKLKKEQNNEISFEEKVVETDPLKNYLAVKPILAPTQTKELSDQKWKNDLAARFAELLDAPQENSEKTDKITIKELTIKKPGVGISRIPMKKSAPIILKDKDLEPKKIKTNLNIKQIPK